ncbi:MerR family transcriptional regulator [Abyssisolibacter fermentans]|uniref:MerR family transcriptional regulator n=1 Tax=Abyssisolibacter fermentans TaxID=1766203 RepID=UPI0008300009|nr:helix-turn-helix domain-containing protein [Abyssisolibacter fermentans]
MKLYSIGEVSKINNITIKTLRYYDKIGLLVPAYIDETNGYRYYSYSQFLIIDKIKKFKYWDIPLNELKDIIYDEDNTKLKEFFRKQREYLDSETKRIEMLKKNLDMLENYFSYYDIVQMNNNVYVRHIKKRHYISHPFDNITSISGIDIELRKIINSPQFVNISVLNPYGYILDSNDFLNGKLTFLQSTVTVGEPPSFETEYLYTAPEGVYVCFSSKILSDNYDITPLIDYIKQNNLTPKLIIAEEFIPNGTYKFENCPYEIQVLI